MELMDYGLATLNVAWMKNYLDCLTKKRSWLSVKSLGILENTSRSVTLTPMDYLINNQKKNKFNLKNC